MVTGGLPFFVDRTLLTFEEITQKLLQEVRDPAKLGTQLEARMTERNVSAPCQDLMRSLLTVEATDRITAQGTMGQPNTHVNITDPTSKWRHTS